MGLLAETNLKQDILIGGKQTEKKKVFTTTV